MTTKFLTLKFAIFPNFIVMEFPKTNSVWGQFPINLPLPNPLQNAKFINIVVSASLILGNERLLLGNERLLFGFFGISFFVAGGFWGSVDRGPRRGFRKYLTHAHSHE